MPTPADIIDLRRVLAERFPQAHSRLRSAPSPAVLPTGVPTLDLVLGGGMPRGEVTELVGTGPGSGSAQVLHALVRETAASGQFLALIDGADSLDVDALEPEVLSRLLWIRCTTAELALKAADLLLRDRNFPLVVLDLKLNPVAQLRRISASVWPRLDRLRERHGTTLLVITPQPLVSGVAARVEVSSRLDLGSTLENPSEILGQLRLEMKRGSVPVTAASTSRVA